MTKEAILDNIMGLVNAASKELGDNKIYDDKVNPTMLNMLAKVFYKVGSAGKYISLIQNGEATTNLLISFPGTPPKMAINPAAIRDVETHLNKLFQADPNTKNFNNAKLMLFRYMYLAGNDLVIQLFINKFNEISNVRKQGKTPNDKFEAFVTQLKDWQLFKQKQAQEQRSLLGSPEFTHATKANFKLFLTDDDILNIKNSLGNNFSFEIFPHDRSAHNGMHVEAKGIAYYINSNSSSNTYNIGLATKFGDEVGCCGACTIEFEVIREEKNITVHRTADFPRNFPEGQYKPSLLIKDNNNLLKIFINKLLETSKEIVHSNDKDYNFYYNELCNDEVQQLGQDGLYLLPE